MIAKHIINCTDKRTAIKHFIAKGFSLAEVLIVVACVIVIALLCLQVLKKIIPDREARMFKKAYNLTARLVPSMVHDEDLYPEVDGKNAPQFLGNTEWVIYEGKKYEGTTKFCGLFAAKINALSEVSCIANASLDGKATLKTNDGIVWVLPITDFKELKTPGIIQIDTNGAKKPNKDGYDRYKIYVYQDGTVSDKPVNMPDLPVIPDEPGNPGSNTSSSTSSSSSSSTSSTTSSSSSGTSSSSSSSTSSGTSSGTSSSSSGTSSSSSSTSSGTSSSTSTTSNTSNSSITPPFIPERNLGLSLDGSTWILFTKNIDGPKKKGWKRVLPQNLANDTSLVLNWVSHYYTIALNRQGVDQDCLYSAYLRLKSLYSEGMRQIYTECANGKPLERGKGAMVSFTFENKTYQAAYAQDDDGKEFNKSLSAAYQTAKANQLGLWLRVLRDRYRYELEINTKCITGLLQKFYEEELDKKYK